MSAKILRTCLICGKEFSAWPSVVAKGQGRFCSKSCGQRKGPNEHWTDTDGTVHIKLTQGKEALVSLGDYPRVAPFRWFAHRFRRKHRDIFYADTHVVRPGGRAVLSMHVLIFEPDPGLEVDHIFGDGLDNRRGQTRNVTRRVNCQNKHHAKSSKYPGVSWHKRSEKWMASIAVLGKKKTLGGFHDELEAASAYRVACQQAEVGASIGEAVDAVREWRNWQP